MSNLVTKFVVKYNVIGRYLTQEEVITRLTNTFGDKLDEYSPDWLGKQRFDIYIPKYNIAIEYNGEQHYKPMAKFGGVIGYNKTVERDSHKLEKCKANNCKLYVLRYNYKNNDLQEIINTIQSLN